MAFAFRIPSRERLRAGHAVVGPAVVTQRDSTTLIHPGHVGTVDPYLNLLIRPAESGREPDHG